ncbi:hypothetical protein V6N11_056077 [Hibiscus sabdariffa]|uniref:RNase H type-1 domain-containing protein n=1 Tax=Hibiscus sabdariffa TaxID=183260 RepID=A0ABR2T3D8_9ROSI
MLLHIAAKKAPTRGGSIDQLGWKLNTDRRFTIKGFTMDASCPRCRTESKDVDHLLRGCGLSVAVWSSVVKPSRLQEFISMNFHTWVIMNLRNSSFFQGPVLVHTAGIGFGMWETDSAKGRVARGGTLEFASSGMASSAYRWGVVPGHMIVGVDSKDVLRLFYSNSDQGRYISIVNHIDALIKRDWLVQCCHIHRNDNRVADALTKLADLSHLDCLCFSIPSSSVAGLLQADIDVLTVS